jgi:hypothetical protein
METDSPAAKKARKDEKASCRGCGSDAATIDCGIARCTLKRCMECPGDKCSFCGALFCGYRSVVGAKRSRGKKALPYHGRDVHRCDGTISWVCANCTKFGAKDTYVYCSFHTVAFSEQKELVVHTKNCGDGGAPMRLYHRGTKTCSCCSPDCVRRYTLYNEKFGTKDALREADRARVMKFLGITKNI